MRPINGTGRSVAMRLRQQVPIKYQIAAFESGDFQARTWGPYREQVLAFLQERDAPAGNYSVRVNRRVRSSLAPGTVRLRPFQHNAIVLHCRPDGADNGGIYELLVIGEFPGWNVRDMHFYFEKFDAASSPEEEPETVEPDTIEIATAATADPPHAAPQPLPAPAGPKLTLSEKLARLERIASRASERELLLKEIETKMVASKKELADLEARYLQVLQEIEADTECKSAAADLRALEQLLGD